MPKQILKIDRFEGGLNSSSDPRDIVDNELSKAKDVMVDQLGTIRMMGGVDAHKSDINAVNGWTGTLIPGYGLFYFSHDRTGAEDAGSSENETGDNYLAMYDDNDQQVWVYSEVADDAGGTGWNDDSGSAGNGVIDIGSTGSAKPTFYIADGALRVSDGNFGANNSNKWYGYTYAKLFQTTDGSEELELDTWSLQDQELKSFDDLNITLALDDCSEASPDTTALDADKIILGWWTGENGSWNGQYVLGAAPVYIGGQEGPVSEAGELTLFDQILYVQVYVCHPDVDSATIATHPLGDNRIIGINLYVRSFPSEDWYILEEIDLKTGGKHGWAEYEADTDVATGFWTSGTGVSNVFTDATCDTDDTAGSGTTFGDNPRLLRMGNTSRVKVGMVISGTGIDGTANITQIDSSTLFRIDEDVDSAQTGTTLTFTDNSTKDSDGDALSGASVGIVSVADTAEYADTNINVAVSAGTAMGTGRKGILRITGFGSTVYKEVDISTTDLQAGGDLASIPVINPANGNKKKFTLELLDENYALLKRQVQAIQIDVDADGEPSGGGGGGGGYGEFS